MSNQAKRNAFLTFSAIFFDCLAHISLMNFQIQRRRLNKSPGCVAAFWAMSTSKGRPCLGHAPSCRRSYTYNIPGSWQGKYRNQLKEKVQIYFLIIRIQRNLKSFEMKKFFLGFLLLKDLTETGNHTASGIQVKNASKLTQNKLKYIYIYIAKKSQKCDNTT